MNKTKLPNLLLDLAKRLKLSVINGQEVLTSSNIGGGVDLDRWLTSYDDEIYIEFALTSDQIENPVGSTRMTEFGPIKQEAAEAMLHRWALLKRLEEAQDETTRETADRVSRELLDRLTHSRRRRKTAS